MTVTITTHVIISAPPAKVWSVLTDFPAYPTWNPFITSAVSLNDVAINVSSTLRITLSISKIKFSPQITAFHPEKSLIWQGKFLMKGLFDGEHRFILEEHDGGFTKLIHEETFSGILIWLFPASFFAKTKNGFEKMNMALKSKVESAA